MTSGQNDRLDRVADTARWTAAERARESARPDRLFDDPLAEALAGEQGRALSERMRRDGMFDTPGFAVRTRFFDDVLTHSVSTRGAASQAVLVAAGMDTCAFRLELPRDLAWYELDRPELLALKDQVLAEVGAAPRCARRPVGVDLTAEWAGPLRVAQFDSTRPTMWLVEGLIFYLDPAAVHLLLDEITRLSAPGSELLRAGRPGRGADQASMAWWRPLVADHRQVLDLRREGGRQVTGHERVAEPERVHDLDEITVDGDDPFRGRDGRRGAGAVAHLDRQRAGRAGETQTGQRRRRVPSARPRSR